MDKTEILALAAKSKAASLKAMDATERLISIKRRLEEQEMKEREMASLESNEWKRQTALSKLLSMNGTYQQLLKEEEIARREAKGEEIESKYNDDMLKAFAIIARIEN